MGPWEIMSDPTTRSTVVGIALREAPTQGLDRDQVLALSAHLPLMLLEQLNVELLTSWGKAMRVTASAHLHPRAKQEGVVHVLGLALDCPQGMVAYTGYDTPFVVEPHDDPLVFPIDLVLWSGEVDLASFG